MLNKMSGTRYCKFEQISSHPWFKGFNWNNLISLDMKSGYKPKLENGNNNKDETKPYKEFISSLKDWNENKKLTFTPKEEYEFEKWFNNF